MMASGALPRRAHQTARIMRRWNAARAAAPVIRAAISRPMPISRRRRGVGRIFENPPNHLASIRAYAQSVWSDWHAHHELPSIFTARRWPTLADAAAKGGPNMRQPDISRETRPEVLCDLIEGKPVALLATVQQGQPVADHLPLVLWDRAIGRAILLGHPAAVNPIARLTKPPSRALAVFQGRGPMSALPCMHRRPSTGGSCRPGTTCAAPSVSCETRIGSWLT